MKSPLNGSTVRKAKAPSDWDFANALLYKLCRDHPDHQEAPVIVAKMWLIGRAYAAAIERMKDAKKEPGSFYLKKVAPTIQRSKIDKWIGSLKHIKKIDQESLPQIVEVHAKVMALFRKISGDDKRSLASKYLHFHRPDLFYIYDSQAKKGLSKLSAVLPRASRTVGVGDNEYRKFSEKCLYLQEYLLDKPFASNFSTRQIDQLLLLIARES